MDSDTDSIDRPVETKQKSRRPPNTAFRQQRLKAWQPILTPKTVLPLFFCIAIIFAPIGGLLLYASNQVQEIVIDYSYCSQQAPTDNFANIPSRFVSSQTFSGGKQPANPPQWKLQVNHDTTPGADNATCFLRFDVPTEMGNPIFMFYRLTNFFQNHRRYVQSFNEDQLNGKAVSASSLKSPDDCKPLTLAPDGRPYYPCGLIANSWFNDSFSSPVLLNAAGSSRDNETYVMTDIGIAWSTDRNRFKKSQYKNDEVVPPPNWIKRYPNGYNDDTPIPDISTWESFQNWMRTAGLPTFSKLALRNDTAPLGTGTYQVAIGLNFEVLEFNGSKSLVLSTRTVIGGRNPFLGIAYLCVAGLCFVLGILFLIKHLIKPRKLGDHSYLSWNQEPAAAGQATGTDQGNLQQRRHI
ncbi:aminophospholipid translocase regulatory protein CDC50 [Sugiyamaella lignohabitans]|uniref:Aminophospholipid translocase regulatory protein CDC50 n=1 Tax=Sugiyamaella lignohabitans TaxID=796027 RepID=A0A167EXD9_9ASCO|nr:aminophospholipid translocase regulatory protein CDC50 [Sugiyamaella lignohabitans]ANB14569.1 aminophospholipid translocase regulatory protein CDC50 [Sugiyamaella lignohabitans]